VKDYASGHVLRFVLAHRVIAVDPGEDGTLTAAVTGSERIKLTNWEDKVTPRLKGAKLALFPDESAAASRWCREPTGSCSALNGCYGCSTLAARRCGASPAAVAPGHGAAA
jgi:hypothetical protein